MRTHLSSRISTQDAADYHNWRISSAQLADLYGTKATYVTRALPPRAPKGDIPGKRSLRKARAEFRDRLALQVHEHQLTIKEAAQRAHCSLRTMFRHLDKVRRDLKQGEALTEEQGYRGQLHNRAQK